jgi:hypothetical protein
MIQSVNTETNEEIIFPSMNAAGKYFDINSRSVQYVANNITKSALSKKYEQKISILFVKIFDFYRLSLSLSL